MISYVALIDSVSKSSVVMYPMKVDVKYKPHKDLLKEKYETIKAIRAYFRFDTKDVLYLFSAPKNIWIAVYCNESVEKEKRMPIYTFIDELSEKIGKTKSIKSSSSLKSFLETQVAAVNKAINLANVVKESSQAPLEKSKIRAVDEWERLVAESAEQPVLEVKKKRQEAEESFYTFDFGDDFLGVGRMLKIGFIGGISLLGFMILIFVFKYII